MIKEDYVSFETAKLLKEKGFDSEEVGCYGGFYSETCYEPGYGIITESGQEVGIVYDDLRNCDLDYNEYLRPTLQMAMKWLREVHKLSVRPRYDEVEDEKEHLYYVWFFDILSMNPYKTLVEPLQGYSTYEEACEAAIQYCLQNLI